VIYSSKNKFNRIPRVVFSNDAFNDQNSLAFAPLKPDEHNEDDQ
jgi:hypothetical protein